MFMEYLADKHPGKLSLIHYFPGLVLTEAFDDRNVPTWFKAIFIYGRPLIKRFAVNRQECGERVLFLTSNQNYPARRGPQSAEPSAIANSETAPLTSSDGVEGGGAYKVNWNGKGMKNSKQYATLKSQGWNEKIVNHTLQVFDAIESGGVFKE